MVTRPAMMPIPIDIFRRLEKLGLPSAADLRLALDIMERMEAEDGKN